MRAEESKGIGVASGKDGVDLRVESRIASSNRGCILRSALLL
jgi:hypothetical protein